MLISTWNVNGLRSVINKNFFDYLETYSPDVLCLQEIKSFKKDVEKSLEKITDDYDYVLNSATRAGYSGTAIFVKKNKSFENYKYNLGIDDEKYDCEGRLTIVENDDYQIFNGYFPNGKDDHSRVEYKLEFSYEVLKRALKNKKNKIVLITGDINTAHTEIDLKNPKANQNTTGFLPIERAYIDDVLKNGFVDVFRHHNPELKDAYTWWTYRNNCREKNVGWRLDYFFINEEALHLVKKIEIKKDVLGSDHCPVHLEIDV